LFQFKRNEKGVLGERREGSKSKKTIKKGGDKR
jgi:hypothetical protein